ncbi:MAG: F0F1 ATP synthase subunit alpha [Candidatus Omnitrophica bacterium CG11_big_fil_rev_8_21_14_0_20_63_9]|nr:MAG: F0F1 ATP synthase subunit alpha [Candidatus Omnitrophica bacterium CG11_big_fil_rev_8_21_14_0_20_63_9]
MSSNGVEIREVGTITEVKRGIVKLAGLPSCIMGQLIELGPGAHGFVVGFTDREVLALTVGRADELAVGQRVNVRQQPLRLQVGPQWLGRVLSPLGTPLDGEAAPAGEGLQPMFTEAPGILARTPVERQLRTGTKVIDAMVPLGRGQRELIIGDRMTGKTTLALDAILNQQGQDVLCIYCSIGQSQHRVQEVAELLRERGALSYSAIIAAPASREASEQFLAPFAAAAVGEFFMQQGRDVLVVFDDLSKHAWAYRQLSLLLERSPGREAYPGDMFYIHAQLMERAGQLSPERGGGSMTFLPMCEAQQGDVTGYITSNLISMTDGQIYLSSELFYEGVKPAVDLGLSVSRIGNKVQSHLLRWASGQLRLELLQYLELLRLTRFASTSNPQVMQRQQQGALLRRLLSQAAHQPMAIEDQTLLFYAFRTGLARRVSEEGLKVCLAGLSGRMPEFVGEMLRANEPLSPAAHAKLRAALEDVLGPYLSPEPGATPHAIAEAPAR